VKTKHEVNSKTNHIFLEQIPIGFVAIDLQGRILAANRLLATLLATDQSELPGRLFGEHIIAADRPLLQKHYDELLAGNNITCRLRVAKLDGNCVWVRLESALLEATIHTAVIDITDHKAAEQQLVEKESRLRTVVETIPDLVWLKDPLGIYISCNKMFERFFGAEAKEIIGKTDYDFVERKMADFFREHDRKAIAAGKPSMNEESLVFATDGQRAIFETIKTPVLDPQGNLIGVLGIARDITERKRMEAALQQSEAKFRQLVQALPLPLTIVHRSGRQEYMNDRFIQVFGYDYADIPTLSDWWRLAYPDPSYRQEAVQRWNATVNKAIDTGKDIEPSEYAITCKNQLVRAVVISGVVLGDLIISTFIDISERRRHEKLMKASFERRRTNELMNELIRADNPSQRIVFESARLMGEFYMLPYSCCLLVIDDFQNRGPIYWQQHLTELHLLQDAVFSALEAVGRIVWETADGIGVVVFEPTPGGLSLDKQRKLSEQLLNQVIERSPGLKLTAGIADPACNIAELREHYRQALTAVQCGKRIWPQQRIYLYGELGVYQLLSGFSDSRQRDAYIERMLGKLLQYDNKRKGELFLETLEIILSVENMKQGAEQLAIHYQTLLFRKQRLEKILGVSLDDFAVKMSLLTALHMLKLRGK
jgi:PAS domain S-box-containing protein